MILAGNPLYRSSTSYDNLLVVQTLSKSRALAGLRVGVAMGNVHLIEALERVKNSFNSYPLDVLAQRAALASLQDQAYFTQGCQRTIASRERLSEKLTELGFAVLPSAANFVFARHPDHAASSLFAALRERGIIVRYFDKPRISEFLRISVGTDAQCDALLAGVGRAAVLAFLQYHAANTVTGAKGAQHPEITAGNPAVLVKGNDRAS